MPDAGPTHDYPVELVSTEHLRDGSEVVFRPIRMTDGDGMTAFHETLSPRSVYRRFFSAHPHLSTGEVERFTHVDYTARMAFVVTDDDRIVAVGRYERLAATDEYQHRGIASRLLVHLAEAARGRGIARFHAQTLSENRDMLSVFLSSGYPVTTTSEAGTVTVRFPIDAVEVSD